MMRLDRKSLKIFILTPRELSVKRKDLQALTLAGPSHKDLCTPSTPQQLTIYVTGFSNI